jgi:hypothetical protein
VTNKALIGWSEYVSFPDWGIDGIKAKVDTGARSSALHVENLEHHRDGTVSFDVILHRRNQDRRTRVRAKTLKQGRVRSSTGEFSERCFVCTRVQIGPVEKEIELSLVSRGDMLFRMLLGRKALEHDFVVEVSRRNLLTSRPRRRKKRKAKPA